MDSKPLPLEALGALLFSISGYMISTTREFFIASHLDKCPQVLLVVIENMSTLDLEEKPNLLGEVQCGNHHHICEGRNWKIVLKFANFYPSGRFRENVERNGLSALVMPALAADHSTGSDLSQVRVNFREDTSIIKHLLR